MKVRERQALRYLNKHKQFMQDDAEFEEKFATAVKKSPSKHSVKCAILAAIDAGWCKALDELLSIDIATYKPVKAKEARHPLRRQIVAKLDLPSTLESGKEGDDLDLESALSYAIASKKVEVVTTLIHHMDLNNIEHFRESPLHHVYALDDQDVKRQILSVIIPRMKPTERNLAIVARIGDLKSMNGLVKKAKPKHRLWVALAGRIAIENGHNRIVRWMIDTPNVMDWKSDAAYIVEPAIERNSLKLMEYLAMRAELIGLKNCEDSLRLALKKYLKENNREFLTWGRCTCCGDYYAAYGWCAIPERE